VLKKNYSALAVAVETPYPRMAVGVDSRFFALLGSAQQQGTTAAFLLCWDLRRSS
jgi:hypothetical protein